MYADTTFATLYNPAEFTPEQLIDRFVVRLNIFERLYKDIQTSDMKRPEQHYLIQGRRGMGKTTLLLRLAYEIEKDPTLNTWMLPVVYNEEEHSINRLSRFWERAAEILADKHVEFSSLPDEMEALHAKHAGRENDFEEAVFELLVSRLQVNKYKIVLFVDNFGTLFRSFNDRENRRLRTVLQTCPDLRIIGATPTVLGEIYDVKHPFYEFFKVERLSGLDKQETRELLLKIGEVTGKLEAIKGILEHQPGRVETLRRFTSGVIRTMVLLFDVFTDDNKGDAFHDLEVIIDRTTPLYQHRMDDLSPNQKPIVEAIALAWDAISTKEIAARTRMESKVVSAQLSQLVENEIVELIQTNTKNHLYQVSERFFNIWYLMRFGRRDARHRVKWLIRFLESWCDGQTLANRAKSHIAALKAGTYHIGGAYLMSEALAGTKFVSRKLQQEVLTATAHFLKERDPNLAKKLSKSDQALHEEAISLIKNKEVEKVNSLVNKMVKPDYYELGLESYDAGLYTTAIDYFIKDDSGDSYAWTGYIYDAILKDFFKAVHYYSKSIKKKNTNACTNLGVLYATKLIDYVKAEKYLKMANKNGEAITYTNLGLFYGILKDYVNAENSFKIAIKKGDFDSCLYLGLLYEKQLNKQDSAEEYYRIAMNKGNAEGVNSLAYLLFKRNKNQFEALVLAQKVSQQETVRPYHAHTAACIFLWSNEIESALALGESFLYDEHLIEKDLDEYTRYLIMLLVKEQYRYLYQFFTSERGIKIQVKDRFKPIWYALMHYMRDQYPAEYLRMGEELRETVEEIIRKVESMRAEDQKGKS